MRALLVVLLGLATALSGCTLFGGEEANVSAPFHDGPHARLLVQNDLPHEARVSFRMLDANGALQSEGDLQAPAGASNATAVTFETHGRHQLLISYSWTAEGEAASGQLKVDFDSQTCDGIVEVAATIAMDDEGRTYGGTSTACGAA